MPAPEDPRSRVLIHAPIGRDGPAVAELLRRVGIGSKLCAQVSDLVEDLEGGAAAAFIAEEGLAGPLLAPLAAWVDAQPAWSDLPFVILTSRRESPAVIAWRENLVGLLRNVSLLERPVQSITLSSTLQAAVRARRRQYEVARLLEERDQAAERLETLVRDRTRQLEEANKALRAQMDERLRMEESLRNAQKMEAIGQLTGGVAHDFNNLLMVISGGLDMLGRHKEPQRRERLIEGMRRAAERGAGLTRQLLAFSRRQPLKPESVDLARQIGGMRELLDRSLRGDVHVALDFAPDLWPVEVDPAELELVVLNLAVNARDAMPEGGTIVIRASNEGAGSGGERGTFVRLSVQDPGTGMREEVKQRVFEPFYTTKEIGRGSGLGLAQVHGFATQSGGTIQIDSAPGQGTTVTLRLPRSTRQPDRAERHLIEFHHPVAAAPVGSVLLVEDDDEVAALVGDMLHQLGYQATRVAGAQAALGALADGRPVDIVFSDIMMPGGMSGIDLAREVRRRHPSLPLLLTTGHVDAAKNASEAMGVRILPKPYLLDDLAIALGAARGETAPRQQRD